MPVVESIEINFNGELRTVKSATVEELLKEFQLEKRKIAVERNREIVKREDYAVVKLSSGDIIEIVQFVGGG